MIGEIACAVYPYRYALVLMIGVLIWSSVKR